MHPYVPVIFALCGQQKHLEQPEKGNGISVSSAIHLLPIEMDKTAGNDIHEKGFSVGCGQNFDVSLFGIYSKLKITVAEYLAFSHHLWLTNDARYSLSQTNFAGDQVFYGYHL